MKEASIEVVRIYSKRFLLLLVSSFVITINALHYLEYSTVASVITDYYGVSFIAVSLTAILVDIAYVSLVYPGLKLLEVRGIRFTLIIGSILMTIAAILKCFTVNRSFFFLVFVAQFIVGSAYNFTYNVGPVLAAKWFPNDEASLAIGVISSSAFIGNSISYIYPLLFKDVETEDEIKLTLFNTKIALTALSILCIILVILFVESSPPQPANFAEARRSRNSNSSNSLMQLFRNANFILISLNVFMTTSVNAALRILLNQIFSKDFTDAGTMTCVTGLAYNISAIVGSLVLPFVLDKTKRYRLLIFSTYSIAFTFSLLFMIALLYKLNYLIFASIFIFGACSYGERVMMLDLIIEVTYPFPEGTSIGITITSSYIFASSLTPFLSWLIESINIFCAIVVIEALLLFGFLPLFFISIELLRNEAEKYNHSTNNEQYDDIEI